MLSAMSEIGISKAHIFGASLGSQVAVVMQTLAPGAQEMSSFWKLTLMFPYRKGLQFAFLRFTS